MESLEILQDNLLVHAYRSAIRLNLSVDFICILLEEIEQRNLTINEWD